MTLANRLATLNPDDQGALARKEAPATSPDGLIKALRLPGLGEWAQLHIIYELTHRGPLLVDDVARSLLARPLGPGARELSEALVQLFATEPTVRKRVIRTLIDAGNVALDMGGGTLDAGGFVIQLAECLTLGGSMPEAAQLAKRLLEVASIETKPYPFAVSAAKRLTGSMGSDSID